MLGPLEGEGECGEFLVRAEPDEAALADGDIRLEHLRVTRSDSAVDAVRGDDEIRIGERLQFADFGLKVLLHAERTGPLLENVEQPPPADSAEAVTARLDGLAPKVHLDIVPVMEVPDDRIMRPGIRRLKARHGLVREHDAPAERIVGPIALVNLDFHGGQRLLQENRAVQAGRASAYENHSFHGRTIDLDALDVK